MTDPAVEALAEEGDPRQRITEAIEAHDNAVQALAEVIADCCEETSWTAADAALDHIAAHLHDDTPEGAALRQRLGLSEETRYGVRRTKGDVGSFVPCDYRSSATDLAARWGATFTKQTHVVSPWRDA